MKRLSAKPPRHLKGGRAVVRDLPKGPNGRALCRQCSTEVPVGRLTFCSKPCVDLWMIRTGSGATRFLKKRDRGICAICRRDCIKWMKEFKMLPADRKAGWLAIHGIPAHRKRRFWDIDHIKPVVEGGGDCGPENLRTLCIPCHRRVTRALSDKRTAERRGVTVEQLAAQRAARKAKQQATRAANQAAKELATKGPQDRGPFGC